jgi:hypothetical protein
VRVPWSQQCVRLEQVDAALARLDAPHGQHVVAQLVAPPVALRRCRRRRCLLEPSGVDAVRDHHRLRAVLLAHLAGDRLGDAHVPGRLEHRAVVAGHELGRRERVEVVDRAQAAQARRQRRVRADAVLRVHDVVVGASQGVAQGADRAQDAGADRLAGHVGERHGTQPHRRVDGTEEGAVPAARERPHVDVGTGPGERLGERERVHDAAARLGRVRQQGHPHDGSRPVVT